MHVHVEQARSIKVRGCRGADPPPAPIFVAAIVLVFTYIKMNYHEVGPHSLFSDQLISARYVETEKIDGRLF